jgi:hypothetical protein
MKLRGGLHHYDDVSFAEGSLYAERREIFGLITDDGIL